MLGFFALRIRALASGLATFLLSLSLLSTVVAADSRHKICIDGMQRSYLVHLPPCYDPTQGNPLVLVLHGAASNANWVARASDMNRQADRSGFVAVYPNGTGCEPFLTWNDGSRSGCLATPKIDDVKFIRCTLDQLMADLNIDPNRVFAVGFSSGAFMCYRLAADLSDRISAIAPIAGSLARAQELPSRPVSLMHFHGTCDPIVPFEGPNLLTPRDIRFVSVQQAIETWRKHYGCSEKPSSVCYRDCVRDGTSVCTTVYGPGVDGAEVVLHKINGGGHTWPGKVSLLGGLTRSTREIPANELIWEFFEKHARR
jgi:polyhydroxybutyrate depolymerase